MEGGGGVSTRFKSSIETRLEAPCAGSSSCGGELVCYAALKMRFHIGGDLEKEALRGAFEDLLQDLGEIEAAARQGNVIDALQTCREKTAKHWVPPSASTQWRDPLTD